MCQMLYPLVLAVYSWISGTSPVYYANPTFAHFSMNYCAAALAIVLIWICSKKDLSMFMRIGSLGVVFIMGFVLYIVYNFFYAVDTTTYSLGTATQSDATDWSLPNRTLVMFNSNFGPLAGILCAGYYLHTCALPLLRSSKNPEKSNRDLFIGYFLVFVSYAICGVLGYIGFMGVEFSQYFISVQGDKDLHGQINQNCLNMFDYNSVIGFVLRTFIFMVVFSTYPLLVYFEMTCINLLFFRDKKVSDL
jgi:amino acid permease